jgi:CheY-like chemotaxis protein/anti-sigma regulatory factor (Ser/Thr protein kinase)
VINDVYSLLEHQFEAGRIKVRRELAPGTVLVRGLEHPLQQVFLNLLLNARDAMPGGGAVNISARRSNIDRNQIEVEIRDNGEGIQPHLLERVFDPLFTTRKGATGLGLSIALQAMAQQGGTIRVSSEPSVGSAFTLVLREVEPPDRTADAPKDESGKRILLVEDDDAVGEGLCALLLDDGFAVRLVTRGSEAVSAVSDFAPDVVVLDVNLGEISGITVFEELKRKWPDLRVIFSTGHADAAALEDVRRQGVPAIMKPYEVADLIALIDQVKAPARPGA